MKTKPFTVRLPPELVGRIEEAASREGVPASTLAAEWLRERLFRPPQDLLARAIVVILAALSEDITKDEATALVREHFLEERKP